MGFEEIEAEMARLDALIRPIASRELDTTTLAANNFMAVLQEMAGRQAEELAQLRVEEQAHDTRDEILILQAWCDQALAAGIAVGPIVDEVLEMSSTVDHYGMGSMRDVLRNYSHT